MDQVSHIVKCMNGVSGRYHSVFERRHRFSGTTGSAEISSDTDLLATVEQTNIADQGNTIGHAINPVSKPQRPASSPTTCGLNPFVQYRRPHDSMPIPNLSSRV
ncbi:hypothetical protein BGX24_008996 [Mortierella sp. AD032]|nr:hypothetical protein BGX24_008996 [Mortierella sp. AD032]